MNDHDLHDLDGAYALDALAPDERAAYENHLTTCAECAARIDGFREAASRLSATTATTPPAALRASVMQQIADTPQLPPADRPVLLADARDRRRNRFVTVAGAAAAVAAIAVAAVVFVQGRSDGTSIGDLLAAPDTVITNLDGDEGVLRIAWSAERDEVAVVGSGLIAPPDGQTYQLWFVLADGVSSAGTFRPDDDGAITEVLDVADLPGTGWGVTIEPDGGSEQPTTEILFLGAIA